MTDGTDPRLTDLDWLLDDYCDLSLIVDQHVTQTEREALDGDRARAKDLIAWAKVTVALPDELRHQRAIARIIDRANAVLEAAQVTRERNLAHAARLDAVQAVIDQARRVSAGDRMTVYVADLELAMGKRDTTVAVKTGANGVASPTVQCADCGGTGWLRTGEQTRDQCRTCNGDGVIGSEASACPSSATTTDATPGFTSTVAR